MSYKINNSKYQHIKERYILNSQIRKKKRLTTAWGIANYAENYEKRLSFMTTIYPAHLIKTMLTEKRGAIG